MPFIASITRMWSRFSLDRQKAEWHRQALAGELGPSAKQEAEAWNWALETAKGFPFSVALARRDAMRASANAKNGTKASY